MTPEKLTMAKIVIKDLTENRELDRKAMRAITGGKSGAWMGSIPVQTSTFRYPATGAGLNLFNFGTTKT